MTEIFAYIGPGAGVSLIGALAGLIGSIGLALLLVVIHPIRAMFRKRGQAKVQPETELVAE